MASEIDNDTPAADRLHIGECLVVLSSREVHAPGARRPVRLTPKAINVLLVLAQHAGQVVTRDELFAQVWPDTLPTNDVLTQAVTQLRKAFGAHNAAEGALAYIETIAKSGYRLMAAVVWEPVEAELDDDRSALEPQAASSTEQEADLLTEPSSRNAWRRARRHVLLVLGLVLLCSCVVMAWLLWRRPAVETLPEAVTSDGTRVIGSPERPYRLITATEGFETWPALSPDGALVAYVDERDGDSILKMQGTGSNAAPTVLVQVPEGMQDRFPAWSPDGREIAFARFGMQGQCEVLVMGVTGGSMRRATRCDGADMLSFDWTPDGRGLVFGSMTGPFGAPGIRVLDLASGRWTALEYKHGPDDFDYAPRYSPDGGRLGFVRNPQVGDLWMMDADGSDARRLTGDAAEIRGWNWLGDGTMVFGRRVDSESRLYRLDVRSRTLRDMGVDDAQSPSVARLGHMLAFMQRRPQFGLFKVLLEGHGHKERLFASSGRDTQPMVSPDGQQLVFTSDRSGAFALWWARLDQPGSLHPLEGLRPETRQAPDWSVDGQYLLVSGRDDAGHSGIYEVQPEQGQWKRLPVPVAEPLQAIHGAEPTRVYVIERDSANRMALGLFDRSHVPWRRLASVQGVSQVRYDRSGRRVLFTRLAGGGLWQADADLSAGSIRELHPLLPTRWRYRAWAVAGNGVVEYLHGDADCPVRLSRLDGPEQVRRRCLEPDASSSNNGLSISPDGGAAYIALAVSDGTDIGVMDVPDERPASLLGVLKWLPALRKMDS